MKKLLLILSVGLIGLTSCEKEEIKTKHYVSFIGIENGYCKINGELSQAVIGTTGLPLHECYSGDVLELVDNGNDYTTSTPVLGPPYYINEYHEGAVASYILVDAQVVKQYVGNGNANLRYVIPYE